MNEDDGKVEQEQDLEPVSEEQEIQGESFSDESGEMLQIVSGPFAVLIKTLDFLDMAWDHAVGKDDFDKMITVVNKTLEVNDRYMAIHITQEDNDERIDTGGHPEQFGFSAEIADRERPPDVKSR